MTRREAREQAFVLLFEKLFNPDDSIQDIVDKATEGRSIQVEPFALRLAREAALSFEELDSIIERHSTKWKTNRISKVAFTILRLAIYELLFMDDIPDKVSVNEAVELAKKFGSDEDASFVNGVLGAVMREKPQEN